MVQTTEPKPEFTVRNHDEGLAALAEYFDSVARQMLRKATEPNVSQRIRNLWMERSITMVRAAHVTRNTKFNIPAIVNNTGP
jgi:hypothetical protein